MRSKFNKLLPGILERILDRHGFDEAALAVREEPEDFWHGHAIAAWKEYERSGRFLIDGEYGQAATTLRPRDEEGNLT